MKEIDFIPEWYKASQNRMKRYHRQYILLASLLAIMMTWSFIIGGYIEKVRADVEGVQAVFEKGKEKVDEGLRLEFEIAWLNRQEKVLEAVTPRTALSCVIGELSYLIRDDIILSKVVMRNEAIQTSSSKQSAPTGSVVQIGSTSGGKDAGSFSLDPTRTKVILTGVAARPADAAMLISRLEQSDYFEQETLVYSKPKKIKEHDVTEFEIQCFVADYKIQN